MYFFYFVLTQNKIFLPLCLWLMCAVPAGKVQPNAFKLITRLVCIQTTEKNRRKIDRKKKQNKTIIDQRHWNMNFSDQNKYLFVR